MAAAIMVCAIFKVFAPSKEPYHGLLSHQHLRVQYEISSNFQVIPCYHLEVTATKNYGSTQRKTKRKDNPAKPKREARTTVNAKCAPDARSSILMGITYQSVRQRSSIKVRPDLSPIRHEVIEDSDEGRIMSRGYEVRDFMQNHVVDGSDVFPRQFEIEPDRSFFGVTAAPLRLHPPDPPTARCGADALRPSFNPRSRNSPQLGAMPVFHPGFAIFRVAASRNQKLKTVTPSSGDAMGSAIPAGYSQAHGPPEDIVCFS